MSVAYERLVQFLDAQMRMSHIYQPLMLEVLFTHGGTASARDIAAAFLAHDESQIDYYEEIVHNMPGKVLQTRGIVRRAGKGYALAVDLSAMSDQEPTAHIVGQMSNDHPQAVSARLSRDRTEHAFDWSLCSGGGLRLICLRNGRQKSS